MNGTKLKDLGLGDVLKLVKFMIVLIGPSKANLPTELELDILTRKIRDSFPNYCIADFELAIDLAGEKKLVSDLGAGRQSVFSLTLYDKPISITYVKELMTAYRAYKQTHPEYKKLIALPESTEPSKREQYTNHREMLLESFKKYTDGMNIDKETTGGDYDLLDKHDELFNPSPESKRKFLVKASEIMKVELRESRNAKIVRLGLVAVLAEEAELKIIENKNFKPTGRKRDRFDEFESLCINRAKRLLVLDYFKGLKEMEMDLELPKTI